MPFSTFGTKRRETSTPSDETDTSSQDTPASQTVTIGYFFGIVFGLIFAIIAHQFLSSWVHTWFYATGRFKPELEETVLEKTEWEETLERPQPLRQKHKRRNKRQRKSQ
ncbi:hypothetical protein BJX99DRAFT_255514 [Aspergillus californicus]